MGFVDGVQVARKEKRNVQEGSFLHQDGENWFRTRLEQWW